MNSDYCAESFDKENATQEQTVSIEQPAIETVQTKVELLTEVVAEVQQIETSEDITEENKHLENEDY